MNADNTLQFVHTSVALFKSSGYENKVFLIFLDLNNFSYASVIYYLTVSEREPLTLLFEIVKYSSEFSVIETLIYCEKKLNERRYWKLLLLS